MAFLHLWSIDLSPAPRSQRRAVTDEALRKILALHLPAGADIELVNGANGKPRLAAGGPEFNLSHSDAVALVALSDERPVGVDVEKVRPRRDLVAVAERAFTPEDAAAVRAATPAERDLVFHRLWARHEARLKCLGAGIFAAEPPLDERSTVEDVDVAPGYTAAVAVAGPSLPSLRRWTFDLTSASI